MCAEVRQNFSWSYFRILRVKSVLAKNNQNLFVILQTCGTHQNAANFMLSLKTHMFLL